MKCSIDVAYNGLEAISKVQSQVYDIIFMDINMPVLNGIDATKQILKYNETNNRPQQKIYAVTAQSENLTMTEMKNVGFNAILSKPVSFKMISDILDRYAIKK